MSYQKGIQAEAIAKTFLEEQGLTYIKSHYRSRFGEIDLIMKDKSMLVFVEVKHRRSPLFGLAYESVTSLKQKKLQWTAFQYLAHTAYLSHCSARFDIISLQGPLLEKNLQINWIKNAFEVRV